MPLKVLISGAGIAGTALAFWLSKLKHNVTVVERHPCLRTTGLQVDLRGPGIDVLRRMGLEEAFRAVSVPEQGLRLVDRKGKSWGYFGANRSGEGLQSFTTDFEIMRADLCRLLYGASAGREGVEYVFGVHVTEVKEGKEERGVDVVFSNGKTERFDLVVGADGLWSNMRRMVMRGEHDDAAANPGYYPLGVFAAYGTIQQERRQGEGYEATAFMAPGNRGIMMRRHEPDRYQAYAFCRLDEASFRETKRGDTDREKKSLSEVFDGAGWESKQIIQGLVESEDFYTERMGVVKLDSWSRGRVVLVGDAAYCQSAMTGMGTTSGMVGSYILAGEIARHCSESGASIPEKSIMAAFQGYEQKLRPYVEQVQKGLTDKENYMDNFPSSTIGIALVYYAFWIASLLRLDIVTRWVLREDTKGWKLPDYPELSTVSES
ncbi:hypothetical protein BJX64DRAFT_235337 [Aspergillus heterothallicus]